MAPVTPLRSIEGKYEILEKLGEGGMGSVYKVRHRLLDEIRVVKVMRPQLAPAEDLAARFSREAKAATQFRHPNIAQLYDFSLDDDGFAFIVMEYIPGMTLQASLRHNGSLPLGLGAGGRPAVAPRARVPARQGVRPPRHLARQSHAGPRAKRASRW